MRHLIVALTALAVFSAACTRDPNVLKQKYLESGNKYFEQKKYKEANIYYRKALDKDKRFGMAYYKLALTDLELGQVPSAVGMLQRAVELLKKGTAESDDSTLKLSEIMLMAAQAGGKDSDQLIAQVQPMVDGLLQRNPNSWEGHKLSGDLALLGATQFFRDGKAPDAKAQVAKAIQEYRTALAAKPGDYVITLALGRTLALDGETQEAEGMFKSLVAKDKTNLNGYVELYRIYVGQKRLDEAESTLKAAIAAVPKDTSMRLMLAQFYFGTHKQDQLVKMLNDMKSDLKSFPQAYFQAGAFYMRVNQLDQAIKEYEAGIKADSKNTNAYLKAEIEAYIRQNNLTMAQSKNNEILKNDPKDPEAKALRATFMIDKGQIDEAQTDLQSVVTARPSNWVARFNLGRTYFAKNQFAEAQQQFQRCIELNPGYLPARYALTQVAIVLQQYDEAVRQADEILKIRPDSVQGRVMKAAALQRQLKYDDARKMLSEVLEKNPNQVETLLEMGVLDLNQKKNKDALEHFKRAYDAAPGNIRGLLGESKALLADGQADKSVDLIRQAVQKTPSFQLQRELGNAQMAARQFDPAIQTYLGLVNGTNDIKLKGDLWSRVGECYRFKGDYDKSIEYMEMSAKALPDNAAIATNLALLYEAKQDEQHARTYYEKALKIDPNNPLVLNNLAYLIVETNGDPTLALSYAQQALQRLPNFLEVKDTMGWIYMKKNMPESAIDSLKPLVQQAPLNPIYHYHYAMALNQKGDTVDAKAECQLALANRPSKLLENQIRTLQASLK
ncbi:MAG TPA: tetratricopeptide repeat protein [Bryobacteraceae bacterium]|nr:tetratricopeptide repeat protein [Bryobacteraceae bacterium]